MIIHVNTAARLLYPQMWKNEHCLNLEMLIEKIDEVAEMDTLSERMKEGNLQKIKAYWEPFYRWITFYYII